MYRLKDALSRYGKGGVKCTDLTHTPHGEHAAGQSGTGLVATAGTDGRQMRCSSIYNVTAGVTRPIYDYNHCRTGDIAKCQVKY